MRSARQPNNIFPLTDKFSKKIYVRTSDASNDIGQHWSVSGGTYILTFFYESVCYAWTRPGKGFCVNKNKTSQNSQMIYILKNPGLNTELSHERPKFGFGLVVPSECV